MIADLYPAGNMEQAVVLNVADGTQSVQSYIGQPFYGLQPVWSGVDEFDGYLYIQYSLDGVNFDTLLDADDVRVDIPINAASGSNFYENMLGTAANYLKVVYVPGTATEGLITLNMRNLKWVS